MSDFQRQHLAHLPPHVTVKWSDEVLSEGFVPFPKKLLRCLRSVFTGPEAVNDLSAVLAIVDYRRERVSRLPSLGYMAFVAGMEEADFAAALDRLEKRKLIVKRGTVEHLDIRLDGLLKAILAVTQEEDEKGKNSTPHRKPPIDDSGKSPPDAPGEDEQYPF